jgi:hypothetical protein
MGSRGPGRADQEKGAPTIIFWASLINRELAPALILSEAEDTGSLWRMIEVRRQPVEIA